MPRVRYMGRSLQSFESYPAGAKIHPEPGKVYQLDEGFDYLARHVEWMLTDVDLTVAAPPEESEKKARGNKE